MQGQRGLFQLQAVPLGPGPQTVAHRWHNAPEKFETLLFELLFVAASNQTGQQRIGQTVISHEFFRGARSVEREISTLNIHGRRQIAYNFSVDWEGFLLGHEQTT